MTDSTALPVLPETTPAPVSFIPSSVSAREQRAREQLDGTIDGFIEKFSEKGFYPLGFEEIIFSLLPQLTEWPLDLQLKVDSERGNTLATYLKGTDPSVIKNSVSVEQDRYGEYVTSTVADDEALFQSIFDQLPVSSRLGVGGNFQGSSSTAGRIVTLRGQLVALLKAKRADVFEVLFAEAPRMKCNTNFSVHNPFLPLWKQHVSEDTPLFTQLLTFNPEVPAERLNAILEQHPLSEEQEQAFLDEYVLPVPFSEALDKSLAEWHKDRGLDGIFRTRTYNEDTDTLARTAAKDELKRLLDYDLWIVEVDADGSYLDDVPAYSTTSILLLHRGDGNYAVKNYHNDEISSFNVGTDSFYRAISSVLQPDQRLTLGMESETDIAGLRRLLGNAAAASNGGWYNPEHLLEVKKELLPDWMINASVGDKIVWNAAVDFYLQALRASQGSPLLSLSEYGDKTQLRAYARTQLRHKLDYDLGLRLDPDEIMVATYELSWTGNQEGSPGDIPFVRPLNDGESGFDGEATFRSLTDLCLENLGVFELNFRMTATFWDKHQRRIRDVSPHYIHQLVRKLNVGNSYAAFLKQRLLDSSLGQWHRDQYAQLMYAQMSLDAIEAKMAKDFADDSSLPSELQNRRYKWVMAVLDHATNSDASTAVEGHRIRAQTLVLKDSSSHDPLDFIPGTTDLLRQLDGLTLQGLLLIAPESNLSVPSVVLYTPMAPDNVSFREYASEKEMQDQLFNNPKLHDYLSGLVPPEQQQLLADILGTVKKQKNLKVRASPLNTTNIFIASYHAEVQRVIDRVDTQTTSTGEANWQSAWKTAGKLVSLLLEFTPLKVRMPLAAARSIHAIAQGLIAANKGDSNAALHFQQAGLLLLDGLPGVKRVKPKVQRVGGLDAAKALKKVPDGLVSRDGGKSGKYDGVYEDVGNNTYYAKSKSSGLTYQIRDGDSFDSWELIDPRNPTRPYRMPIYFDGQGEWLHLDGRIAGGGKHHRAKTAPKSDKKGDKGKDTPPASSVVNTPQAESRMKIDMEGFFESDNFIAAENTFIGEKVSLRRQVTKAVDLWHDRGKGHYHRSEGGFTIDLPHLGGSSGGRGKWRLQMRPFFKTDTTILETGAMRAVDITDPH